LDENKKAAKPTLNLSRVVFTTRMRATELAKLELALSQVFSDLDESKKATKPTLDLSRVVFIA
jgi:hypothetical protein